MHIATDLITKHPTGLHNYDLVKFQEKLNNVLWVAFVKVC